MNPIPSILLTATLIGLASSPTAFAASMPDAESAPQDAKARYGQMPIAFEANQGQTDAQVRFLSRGPGYSLFLTPGEAVLSLRTPGGVDDAHGNLGSLQGTAAGEASRNAVVRLSFDGANPAPVLAGEQALASRSHYFLGSDAKAWQRDVANFSRVRYEDLYPGVDLVYYGSQKFELEYDLVVAPGTDPSPIALHIEGAQRMRLDAAGNLVLATAAGDLVQQRPIAFQVVDGARRAVDASYRLLGADRIGFELGAYDRSRELVIDPVLVYSTYLGGTLGDRAWDVAVDGSRNAYVVGVANSSNFPVKGAYQSTNPSTGGDAFVAKLGPTGALLYSTYLGGTGAEEASGVAIDASGNVYVTGRTTSLNYPTVSAYQSTLGGVQDAFLAKLSPSGSSLVFSTYLGGNTNITNAGSSHEFGYDVAVDANGSAVVAGWTLSTNFPVVGALQPSYSSIPAGCVPASDTFKCARSEAFVTKFSANGTSLIYSTFLGGTEFDEAYSLALDASGNAYVTGTTTSANFPTAAPKQPSGGGNGDAFVAKLNPAGNALVYSTYLGGVGQDLGYGIAVDSSGSAYVAGVTASANFPTVGPAQSFNAGLGGSATDAFVTKVSPAGNAWTYSTWIGGSGADSANGIAVDSNGNAYIAGQTTSAVAFPTTNGFQQTLGGGSDAFVLKLTAAGNAYAYSSYLGGGGGDYGNDVAVDAGGDAYVVGYSASGDFPVAAAYPAANAGNQDAFVSRVSTSGDATLSINDVSITEGNSGTKTATFTVSLSKSVANTVSFTASTSAGSATAGNDYVTSSQSALTIAAGATSRTVSVTINGDTTVEQDETFFLNLSSVTGALIGDGQGTGTILNDDAPSLSIGDVAVAEGNSGTSTATFTISLSGPSANATTFDIATSNGTAVAGSDYVAASANGLVIAAGATSRTFSVTINGDTATEPNETFFVSLSNASNAAIGDGQAVGTINNDDTAALPALSVGNVSVTEGNSGTTAAVFTVSLNAVAQADVSFSVFTSGNTAGSPSDFTALNLAGQVIPAGSSNKTFTVLVNGDTQLESNETFFLNVSSVSGATVADSQGTGTILNDDTATLPAMSVNDVRVTEGNAGTVLATFTVQLSAVPASTVSFDVATANGTASAGSDYVAIALSGQTIGAGFTSKTFNVTINGDTSIEGDETFSFNLGNPTGATIADGQGVGTIANDDSAGTVPPQISVPDASVVEGDNGQKSLTFNVFLSAATTGPVTFDIATSNGSAFAGSDYEPIVEAGQISAGQTVYSFTVPISPDTDVEANETFTVNLNNVLGATVLKGQGRGVIVNDDEATLSVLASQVTEGNAGSSTATFSVVLSRPMPTPVTFTLATGSGTATAGDDYEPVSKQMLLDAGRTRVTLNVKILGDTKVEADEAFELVLSSVSGASIGTAKANQTILNDDVQALAIAQIQGTGALSPVQDQAVETEGVVTALTADGFFLQSLQADADARSSEGLFIAGFAGATVAVGDRIRVAGRVSEVLVGRGSEQLTHTQMAASRLDVLASGQALPAAVVVDAGSVQADPSLTAYERFEGMRVSVPELAVVSASGGSIDEATGRVRGDGRFHGVAAGIARPFLEPGLSALSRAAGVRGVSPKVFDTNPERLRVDALGQRGAQALAVDAGDTVRGLVGVLAYGEGAYRLLPDPGARISVQAGAKPQAVRAANADETTIGSLHLRRFFDDRAGGSAPVLASSAYATRLAKTANAICSFARNPDILGLSGLEGGQVLRDIAAATSARDGNLLFPGSCVGKAAYAAALPAGASGQSGFLVNGAAVRPGVPRVEVIASRQFESAARFRHRDGSNESLHVAAPQLLQARINAADGGSRVITVLNAQLSALEGDLEAAGTNGWATRGDYLRARRAAQARAIAHLVAARQRSVPGEELVVLGNFEAAQFDDGASDLMGLMGGRTAPRGRVLDFHASPLASPLSNLTTRLPAAERYTVVREGNAQAVDHILVSDAVLRSSPAARVEVARVNADFGEDNYADASVPVRVSDHDPVVLFLGR